jgi:hypothetical protein
MITTDVERALIADQMQRDTVWCYPCSMQTGRPVLATCRYYVEGLGDAGCVPACAGCLRRALRDGIRITLSEPVTQPAYVDLLTRLLS